MSDLAQKKLREWRSGAIHNLLDIEEMARQIRDRLEADPQRGLVEEQEWINDLHSEMMGLVSFLDRVVGMEQAGLL